MNILAISGSTKSNSTSHHILNHIKSIYRSHLVLNIFDGIDKLPHFNPGIADEDLPKEVLDFRNRIAVADGVIFCTPEYVFSIPGSLKNAIEWCVSTTVFSHKPTAIIVAAASGEKAYESLGLIMTTIETILPEESKLLIQGAKGKVNTTGEITDSDTLEQIERVIQSLVATIEDENKRPTKLR
ncbi:MAG: FMN reductase [Ignavibacteriae bacterium HGW-Ignavibacteriae-4]|jgi:NAD(P)H-dependent FMN reductase|nr:MAG: FMN reductase [Ignavibacteriae bacterium HGW-Ignavibacteriae-4]